MTTSSITLSRRSIPSEGGSLDGIPMPVFIILFVIASLLNTLGLTGQFGPNVQLVGRWVLVVALAAVGLQGHWRAFAGAGARPLLLGLVTWVTIAVSSLGMQAWTSAL